MNHTIIYSSVKMNLYLEKSYNIPLGELFDNTLFRRAIREFYYTLPRDIQQQNPDYFSEIFGNPEVYRRFLRYFIKRAVHILGADENSIKHVLLLLTFEKIHAFISQSTKDSIREILDWDNYYVFKTALETRVTDTDTDYWNSLRKSVYRGISVSNLGEVLYFIAETEVGATVYSHARGVHHVDTSGKVVAIQEYYQEKIEELLHTLCLFLEIAEKLNYSESLRVFRTDKTCSIFFQEIEGQKESEAFFQLKFRSWIYRNIERLKHELQKNRQALTQGETLSLVVDNIGIDFLKQKNQSGDAVSKSSGLFLV